MKKTYFPGVLATLFLFFCSVSIGQLQNAPWPMYGHDLRHSGQSGYSMNLSPELSWSYALRAAANSATSPIAIDSEGKIYVGNGGALPDSVIMYCLNADQTLSWSYRIVPDGTGSGINSCPAISSEGDVYFAADNTNLYALSSADHSSGVTERLGLPLMYRLP